jgi:ribulose-5-phosphate 4-epimerase/fuculose-1-phosphate aldolase
MSNAKIREQICVLAKSMFDRGLTAGASGNISVRLEDNSLLVTPTGACLAVLIPASFPISAIPERCYPGMPQPKKCRCIAPFMKVAKIQGQ